VRLCLLNGPPFSGKDTIGNALHSRHGWHRAKFVTRMKRMVHAAYGLAHLDPEHFAGPRKDQPADEFHGETPRRVYIEMVRMFRLLHGDEWFGEMLARDIQALPTRPACVVVTDAGFWAESAALVNRLRPTHTLVVRITRPGTSYRGDNRGPLDLASCLNIDVTNEFLDDPLRIADLIAREGATTS
jgi:hypothetical protein